MDIKYSEKNNKIAYGFYTCSLLSSVLNNTAPEAFPNGMNLKALYDYQNIQSVSCIAYYALKKLELSEEQLKEYSEEHKMMLLREARFEIAGNQVFDALEKAEIPYIPLKGIIMKTYYPHPSMRSFTDYDIYISDKADAVRSVMENLGYSVKNIAEYDIGYEKKPSLHFEMHSSFFEDRYSFGGYFDKPFEKAIKKENKNYCYLQSNEDFFIHTFCHLYKHFTFGGCGIRQFMDIYILTKFTKLDFGYIEKELEKLKLTAFYSAVKKVNETLFDGKKPDKDIFDICGYIFCNGTFGTDKIINIREYNESNKKSMLLWKIRTFTNRWGLPFSSMKQKYKILTKLPFLLPFCYLHKAFSVLFFKHDVLKAQLRDINGYNHKYSDYLKYIRKISGIE